MSKGRIIANRFRIANPEQDLLGRGGMGEVYRGLSRTLEATVAELLDEQCV